MDYDIKIPIKIGLFTLTTAFLICYFLWLIAELKSKRHHKDFIFLAILHILIMLGGLLLTGFAARYW